MICKKSFKPYYNNEVSPNWKFLGTVSYNIKESSFVGYTDVYIFNNFLGVVCWNNMSLSVRTMQDFLTYGGINKKFWDPVRELLRSKGLIK